MIKVVDKEEISHNQYDEIINDTEFRTWCHINNKLKFLLYKSDLLGVYYAFVFKDYIVLEYALREKYRNQNYGFAFLNIVTELVGKEYADISYMLLWIHPDNKKSSKIAQYNGYTLDFYLREMSILNGELDNLYPFVKRNEFYKTDKKRKLFCQQ